MSRSRCPMDGALIPQVGQVTVGSEIVALSWCKWCQELFAFLVNSNRDAAGFTKDDVGGWKVFRAFGSDADVQMAKVAAAQVNPGTLA
ncbi:MAG: hypothetical protein WAN65_14635 [Candidatus Sulfotelmatobacter sp.]